MPARLSAFRVYSVTPLPQSHAIRNREGIHQPRSIAAVGKNRGKKAQYVVGDQESGAVWVSAALSFTGELNRSCTADLIMGMS